MYDRRALERPDQFLLGRPQDVYCHYGAGIHTCLGREVAHAQILAITGELLRLKNLRRERGTRGRILWDGPSPHRLVLRFDP
jgi:cytochrome P450